MAHVEVSAVVLRSASGLSFGLGAPWKNLGTCQHSLLRCQLYWRVENSNQNSNAVSCMIIAPSLMLVSFSPANYAPHCYLDPVNTRERGEKVVQSCDAINIFATDSLSTKRIFGGVSVWSGIKLSRA